MAAKAKVKDKGISGSSEGNKKVRTPRYYFPEATSEVKKKVAEGNLEHGFRFKEPGKTWEFPQTSHHEEHEHNNNHHEIKTITIHKGSKTEVITVVVLPFDYTSPISGLYYAPYVPIPIEGYAPLVSGSESGSASAKASA